MAALRPEKPRIRRPGAAMRLRALVVWPTSSAPTSPSPGSSCAPGSRGVRRGLRDNPARHAQPLRAGGARLHHHRTPGTVWVDYDAAKGTMLLHVLDLIDEDGVGPDHQGPLRAAADGDIRMSARLLELVHHPGAQVLLGLAMAARPSGCCAGRARRTGSSGSTPSTSTPRCCCWSPSASAPAVRSTSRRRWSSALLGFVSTAALAKFLMRGEVIE